MSSFEGVEYILGYSKVVKSCEHETECTEMRGVNTILLLFVLLFEKEEEMETNCN